MSVEARYLINLQAGNMAQNQLSRSPLVIGKNEAKKQAKQNLG